MARINVTHPWPPFVRYVAAFMRDSDRAEADAAYGPVPPEELLETSIRNSTHVWCAVDTYSHLPVAVFGVSPFCMLGGVGAAWMIGTPNVERFGRELLTLGRKYVARMHVDYPELTNFVSAEHTSALAWLRHLGFEVLPARPYGYARQPFHQVVRKELPKCATQTS